MYTDCPSAYNMKGSLGEALAIIIGVGGSVSQLLKRCREMKLRT